MVVRINSSKSISRALNYNEQKVKKGAALCLYAGNFLKEASHLSFYEKLHHFQQLQKLSEGVKTNSVHTSLSFHPSEKISDEKMIKIGRAYMDKIGFGEQPYLIYRHLDAGHPHLHLVTTNITWKGERISLHNLGRNESEKARKELEHSFHLVQAEKQKSSRTLIPITAQRVRYGKGETKAAIASVLATVLRDYKFASLAELNAVLGLYHVVAQRGEKGSLMYEKGGLTYSALDWKGKKIGVPLKASLFPGRPTLSTLTTLFKQHRLQKGAHRNVVKATIHWALLKGKGKGLEAFKMALQKERIDLVERVSPEGLIYGLTYVDRRTKTVFNGSDLGKECSAKAVLHALRETPLHQDKAISLGVSKDQTPLSQSKGLDTGDTLLDPLLTVETDTAFIPSAYKKRKKKGQKRSQ